MEIRDLQLVQRIELIESLCAGKKVLHLGCTNHPYTDISMQSGTLLHNDLAKICGTLYGFDYDVDGIESLKRHGFENLHTADLEHLEDVRLAETFDVIVAGEMIEHLNNPGLFLKGIQRFMDPTSKLVITTVNAYCGMRFGLYALRGKAGIQEPVHPDHTAYYSYSTLKLLLQRQGLLVKDILFYDLGKEHRTHAGRLARLLNDISVLVTPHLADGIIAICGKNTKESGQP